MLKVIRFKINFMEKLFILLNLDVSKIHDVYLKCQSLVVLCVNILNNLMINICT